jgi:hypothetical protein
MPYKCAKDKAKYQRAYRERRGEELLSLKRDTSKQQYQARRNLLAHFTCISCQSLDPTTTQWHHLEPELKRFRIFKSGGYSEDSFWNEVLKCVPLCANCHLKLHMNKLCLLPIRL